MTLIKDPLSPENAEKLEEAAKAADDEKAKKTFVEMRTEESGLSPEADDSLRTIETT